MKILKIWLLVFITTLIAACGNDGVVPGYGSGEASSIVGKVTVNKTPVTNVTLAFNGAESGVVATDIQGAYNTGTITPGGYTVTPSLTGYTFSPLNQMVTVNKNGQITANFTATQGQYIVSGTITGDIKQGVSLTMYDTNNVALGTVQSDANGIFLFKNITPGTYSLIPVISGYTITPVNTTVTVTNGNITTLSFATVAIPPGTVKPGVSNIVSGTITGAVVSNVSLTIYNSNGVALSSVTSDANGWYSFTVASNGSFTVVPNLTGYTFTPNSSIISINNSNATGINFVSVGPPPGSTTITYSLAGAISGAINGGVVLSLYDNSNVLLKTTTSDPNGYYNFNGLAAGTYKVIPAISGYGFTPATSTVTINTTNNSTTNFTATKLSHALSGNAGAPYTRLDLTGPSTVQSTISDAAGNYSFQVFLPGQYTVVPSKNGYSFTQPQLVVSYAGADVPGLGFMGTFVPSINNNGVHGSTTYSCVGATITVPANVTTVVFDATGGDGSNSTSNDYQGGGGGGAALAYDYTAGQWLFFIGGGGGGGGGLAGNNQAGGSGGNFTTFAHAGRTALSCGSGNGIDGSTYLGGDGGSGGPFNFNNYGGLGGRSYGSGRGGNGGTFGGNYTSCSFFTSAQGSTFQSQGCPGDGGIASGITADTGRGGNGGYSGYSQGGGGGGGYGGGGGGAGGGHNGNGCEEGGSGGGGGNYVLPGAIISGNTAMFNIDLSNHVIGMMGSPGGRNVQQNGQCGTVTASW